MQFEVIKHGDMFLVTNRDGNIPNPRTDSFGYGLFLCDTRGVSRFEFETSIASLRLVHCDASTNVERRYRLINVDPIPSTDDREIPPHAIHVTRIQWVDGHQLQEECRIENFTDSPVELTLFYALEADFCDMFEVRGFHGPAARPAVVNVVDDSAEYTYITNDGWTYVTRARLVPGPHVKKHTLALLDEGHGTVGTVRFEAQVALPAKASANVRVQVEHMQFAPRPHAEGGSTLPTVSSGARVSREHLERTNREWLDQRIQVEGTDAWTTWVRQGMADLHMLVSDIGYGPFAVAGLPWYAVPFGRDSLITAYLCLSADPTLAAGTLRTMAAYQGKELNPERDEEPGKIMHELRRGEWARSGWVPFHPYYGSIDATPLFLILAAAYAEWTGDLDLVRSILPHVHRGFEWMKTYGDRDGDGFLEYACQSDRGLSNQGWKDSGDGIVHPDGTLVQGPIALCEVQAYAYLAYQLWADLYTRLGDNQRSAELHRMATSLQARFLETFWSPKQRMIALALDGAKRPVLTPTSNMGQVLWTGILPGDVAHAVIDRLMEPDLFSGFGIRTLAAGLPAYNPLSYHRGSVWPHDNALIALGMSKYGRWDACTAVIQGLLRAASSFDRMRLPELFGGFGLDETTEPVPYPVSCSPQAWAAATPVAAVQALLGLRPDSVHRQLHVCPVIPEGVTHLRVRHIHVGTGSMDLLLTRASNGQPCIAVERNTSGWAIVLDSNCGR
ncbi:MAG: amylo-alpha-1,6-glucosidase [Thermoflavifilum sp.]|nr:amylo-alpha-1,6-glucosidase [Thermoflavifilum sp.]MCL6512805.1 amylo-alpha-1,6-glucosidase [Alicyclobacillus sp.]